MNPNYPSAVAVHRPNRATVDFFATLNPKPRVVAEIGCYQGHTSQALLSLMPDDGELHLYDFKGTAQAVADRFDDQRIRVFGNSSLVLDSYNWSLMKVLADHEEPIYDYVLIDGAHTWHHDALAFLLVDRLLKRGGHVDFDDYQWTFRGSPSLNPNMFPKIADWYTAEQIDTAQVALVVDLLVRRDHLYVEVLRDRIFQKSELPGFQKDRFEPDPPFKN